MNEVTFSLAQNEIQVVRVLIEDAINALNEGSVSERWNHDRMDWSHALFTMEYCFAKLGLPAEN